LADLKNQKKTKKNKKNKKNQKKQKNNKSLKKHMHHFFSPAWTIILWLVSDGVLGGGRACN